MYNVITFVYLIRKVINDNHIAITCVVITGSFISASAKKEITSSDMILVIGVDFLLIQQIPKG